MDSMQVFLDPDRLLNIFERWFQLLCFALAFYITLRAGLINIAFAGIAGLAAIGFVYIGNKAAFLGPIAVLLVGLSSATAIAFALTSFVRWVSKRAGFPGLLVSLFFLYIFNWVERVFIQLGSNAEVQQQRTPNIALPKAWSDFLSGTGFRFPWVLLCGIFLVILVFAALRNTLFNYRTEVLAQNRDAILLSPNLKALDGDAWVAIGIAAIAVAWWVAYDVGLNRGIYEPGRYMQSSFLGLAAAVCIARSTGWLILLCLLPALGEDIFYYLATGHTQIPSSAIFLLFGLIIMGVAAWQYWKYGRNMVRIAGG